MTAAREKIIAEGARLLAKGGREALTTRAVADAAGVQAPAIYRLFGDKDGLLEAVAEDVLARFVARKKAMAPRADALDDLRLGWDLHVEFSLEHPAIFSILNADPKPGRLTRVAEGGIDLLRSRINRVAAAGLLRVSEERAVALMRAAGTGTVMMLLGQPERERDAGLSVAAREAAIAAITTSKPAVRHGGPASAAIALRAALGETTTLSPGERLLLDELLDRIAAG